MPNTAQNLRFLTFAATCLLLASCSYLDRHNAKYNPQQTISSSKIASGWQATLPHGGQEASLEQFWQQLHDPLLVELIGAAQNVAPSIAAAKSRIFEAKVNAVRANAARLPTIVGGMTWSRTLQKSGTGAPGFSGGAFNTTRVGLDASWEPDIFGTNTILLDAAKVQEKASKANWHEARVSVAAEVAAAYFNQRFCQLQLDVQQADVNSRAETARLTKISSDAGFSSAYSSSLANAGLADAKQLLTAQQAQCDLEVKSLVALTQMDEPALREKLSGAPFDLAKVEPADIFSIAALPADVIKQRPDIYNAEAALISAAANIRDAQTQMLPKVEIDGSLGYTHVSNKSFVNSGTAFPLGPVSISLPIFDGGVIRANIKTSKVHYEEAAADYRSKVQYAVKEVEDALVNLHSTAARQVDLQDAIKGYKEALTATEVKVKAGFANLIELEEIRRSTLLAETTHLDVSKQRIIAWVALYRAVGGGWTMAQTEQAEQEIQ